MSGHPSRGGARRWQWTSLVAIALAAPARAQDTASVVALERVTVVDVERGELRPAQTVLVRGDRIREVGPSASVAVPAGATRVDGRGKFVVPGLWDMHVHVPLDDSLRAMFVRHGVTGVREMGNTIERVQRVRAEIAAGRWRGPRYVTSVLYVDGPSGYREAGATLNPSTPAEAVAAVDSLVRLRADFVKVLEGIPRAAFLALAETARARGLAVAGHWPAELTMGELARTGPASIEHAFHASTTCLFYSRERCDARAAELEPARLAANARLLAEAGTWITPTLVNQRRRAFAGDSAFGDDPRLAMLPRPVAARWLADTTLRRRFPAIVRSTHEREAAALVTLQRAGVRLLAGTDGTGLFLFPGASLHDELVLMVEAGLTPADALRAATIGPATFLGATDSLGTVAPARLADLLLLDGDPLADIRNVRRVHAVMLGGRWARRP